MRRSQANVRESPFETAVIARLSAAGYRLTAQHAVGAYRIDLVVEGATARLAVECDGDRFHRDEDVRRDADRQAILERLGWTFVRIRGSRFYRDPDAALAPVFARLADLGIRPESEMPSNGDGTASEMLTRVRARAAEILHDLSQLDERPTHVPGRKRDDGTRALLP